VAAADKAGQGSEAERKVANSSNASKKKQGVGAEPLSNKASKPGKADKEGAKAKSQAKIAVVMIRGLIGARREVRDTFKMLNLERKHSCALIPDSKEVRCMLEKVKDYATWGEVDAEVEKKLESASKHVKKGRVIYRLKPPRKGFGKNGLKASYKKGGALGYRGPAINELLERML